jgi:hypothetical protein
MDMVPVVSSMAIAHGYDPETGVLRVEFKGGRTYEYPNFPPDAYKTLATAKSFGSHFSQHVRPHYKGVRIEEAA